MQKESLLDPLTKGSGNLMGHEEEWHGPQPALGRKIEALNPKPVLSNAEWIPNNRIVHGRGLKGKTRSLGTLNFGNLSALGSLRGLRGLAVKNGCLVARIRYK